MHGGLQHFVQVHTRIDQPPVANVPSLRAARLSPSSLLADSTSIQLCRSECRARARCPHPGPWSEVKDGTTAVALCNVQDPLAGVRFKGIREARGFFKLDLWESNGFAPECASQLAEPRMRSAGCGMCGARRHKCPEDSWNWLDRRCSLISRLMAPLGSGSCPSYLRNCKLMVVACWACGGSA